MLRIEIIKDMSLSIIRLKLDHLLFFVFVAAIFLLHSNLGFDYYWHITAGSYLSETQHIPSGDPFSFTFKDKPWVMHEWLFELMLNTVYESFGHYGVRFVTASLMSLALFVAYRTAVNLSEKKSIAVVLTTVTFILYMQFALPRPQVITYLFFACYIYTVIGYKYAKYQVNLLWLPLIMLFWVNMHGGFIVGLALLVLFVSIEAVARLFIVADNQSEGCKLKPMIIALIMSLLASLINPYGFHQWVYPFQVMSMSATHLIAEWKSPDFHLLINKLYLFYFLGFVMFYIYGIRRPSLAETVLPLFFVMMSIVSIRHVPIALLIMLPFYVAGVQRCGIKLTHEGILAEKVVPWFIQLHDRIQSGPQLGKTEYIFNWILLLLLLFVVTGKHIQTENRLSVNDNASIPFNAVKFIKETGISGNVLNSYQYGGYLINQLYPQSRVFIDGRADLYGDKFFQNHQTIINARQGWKDLFAMYPIDYLLCENSAPILWHLKQQGEFVQVYRDEYNTIMVRKEGPFRGIIEQYGNKDLSPD